jgi:hypothetical protein
VSALLQNKIEHVLTEARMVLPGVQAMLSFQFVTVFLHEFELLPYFAKCVHYTSLAMINLSMILLSAPAIYHHVVQHGEASESFHKLASKFLIAAMVFMVAGISLGGWLLMYKITGSVNPATVLGAAVWLVMFSTWFGPYLCRR